MDEKQEFRKQLLEELRDIVGAIDSQSTAIREQTAELKEMNRSIDVNIVSQVG